jgi:hypothetical protein
MSKTITCALLVLLWAGSAAAQYRQNDELHVSNNPVVPLFDAVRVSPNQSASKSIGDCDVVIEWGAPSVRGRRLTGGLISTYKVWRTGANEATTIHFDEDVLIEGEHLPAGTYALFTIGGKKKWTIIFNGEYQQWGAFTYDRKKDSLRVKVDPGSSEEHEEQLTFTFEDATDSDAYIQLRWGELAVRFRVEVAPNQS